MDTMPKESSSSSSAMVLSPPLPPPPPPPLPLIHNGNGHSNGDSGRSQLLADIRKGMVLNKAPVITKDSNHNELSSSDRLKKQTQDLLHAELSNTLKRRKPVVINEPPKYEYPTYDNSNGNGSNGSNSSNNNNNNKINDSSHSKPVNTNDISHTPKPMNLNAVLSVVTGIKLPDAIQYDANAVGVSSSSSTASADKRKISHGKPNFIINHQKENKPIGSGSVHQASPLSSSSSTSSFTPPLQPKMHNNGTTTIETTATTNVQPKLQRPSYFTHHSIGVDKTIVKTTPMAKPAIETNGAASQVEKCKSIFMIKSQISQDDSAAKSIVKCPLKLDSAVKSNAKHSIDESCLSPTSSSLPNGIPFASVANKKALFEKSAQSESQSQKSYGTLRGAQTEKLYFTKPPSPSSSTSSSSSLSSPPQTPHDKLSNDKCNLSNGQRRGQNGNVDCHKKPNGITTVSLNKNGSYGGGNGTIGTSRTNDAVDHFAERSVHETATSKTTTTTTMKKTTITNKYETKQQFEQKTIVSFSKDLLNAPNNYPEQIRVKKTITNGQSTVNIADTPFHNIRFSIKTNGQVIPKAK